MTGWDKFMNLICNPFSSYCCLAKKNGYPKTGFAIYIFRLKWVMVCNNCFRKKYIMQCCALAFCLISLQLSASNLPHKIEPPHKHTLIILSNIRVTKHHGILHRPIHQKPSILCRQLANYRRNLRHRGWKKDKWRWLFGALCREMDIQFACFYV